MKPRRGEVSILDNATNLGALGSRTFPLVPRPLRLRGTTGSPVRLVALVE